MEKIENIPFGWMYGPDYRANRDMRMELNLRDVPASENIVDFTVLTSVSKDALQELFGTPAFATNPAQKRDPVWVLQFARKSVFVTLHFGSVTFEVLERQDISAGEFNVWLAAFSSEFLQMVKSTAAGKKHYEFLLKENVQ